MLAHTRFMNKEYDESRLLMLELLREPDESRPPATTEWILAVLPFTWLWQEKYAEQIEFLTEYIARHPDAPHGYRGRAPALWHLGRLQEALADYSRALQIEPRCMATLCNRGQLLAEMGEFERAVTDLDLAWQALQEIKIITSEQKQGCEARICNGWGVACAGLGDFPRAFTEFSKSIALEPENAWAYFNRARAYEAQNQREEAIADYRTALETYEPKLSPLKKKYAEERLRELLAGR